MQRLMQALGAYAFLGLVQKNRAFLAHIPAALDSLAEVLTGIEGSDRCAAVASASANRHGMVRPPVAGVVDPVVDKPSQHNNGRDRHSLQPGRG